MQAPHPSTHASTTSTHPCKHHPAPSLHLCAPHFFTIQMHPSPPRPHTHTPSLTHTRPPTCLPGSAAPAAPAALAAMLLARRAFSLAARPSCCIGGRGLVHWYRGIKLGRGFQACLAVGVLFTGNRPGTGLSPSPCPSSYQPSPRLRILGLGFVTPLPLLPLPLPLLPPPSP